MDGSVIVIGVRFDTASPLSLDPADVAAVLAEVAGEGEVEAAVLATCERTELHLAGIDAAGAIERFHHALGRAGLLTPSPDCLQADPYVYVGRDAITHLGRVAAGLDSRVLGDHDVLGQVREALRRAEAVGTAGPALRRAYRHAIAAGRRCRAETSIAAGGTGIAGAVADVARQAPIGPALVVGAGTAGRAVARRLAKHGRSVVVANRTAARAEALAAEVGGRAVPIDQVAAGAAGAAVVVAAAPIALDAAACAPGAVLIDIAVPAAFGETDRPVVTLQDLRERRDEQRLQRLSAAVAAERMVRDAASRWAEPERATGAVA